MKSLLILLALFPFFGVANPGTPLNPQDTLNCDTLWLKSGKIMLVTILSDDGTTIQFTECPPTEIISSIPKSSTKLSPRDSALAVLRATQCDTIFLSGGEIETGHMKYYNSRKVVYTGCCENCNAEKILKRKSVDSIHYANGKKVWTKVQGEQVVQNNQNNTPSITPEKAEKVYTESEKKEFKKKSKLWGWLTLGSGVLSLTSLIIVVAVTTITIGTAMAFGIGFFITAIAAVVFATLFVRNRRKAGLSKKK